MLYFGLIGCGRHGTRYLRHFLAGDIPRATLAAIARRNLQKAKELERQTGIPCYTDYHQLLKRKDIDAVIITTPNSLHAPIAVEATKAQKHILVEKPMALTTQECKHMIEEAKKHDLKLMVAHTLRYHPTLKALKDNLHLAGKPIIITMILYTPPILQGWWTTPQASALLDLGPHQFDTTLWLLQRPPQAIQCITANITRIQTHDWYLTTLKTNNTIIVLQAGRITNHRQHTITITGTQATLRADLLQHQITITTNRETRILTKTQPQPAIPPMLKDLITAIEKDQQPPITGQDGLKTIELIEKCIQAQKPALRIHV